MFSGLAPRYDLANQVLSFGAHHLWRNAAVRLSGARPGWRVLDCATGTGDLAFAFEKRVGASGAVVGTDFSDSMVATAAQKGRQRQSAVRFDVADATRLPFASASFDASSMSFGIRNVDSPIDCLTEMARVVRPGGVVVVLEFGQPTGAFGALYRWYSRVVMPRLGGYLTGDRGAYEYLPRTAAAFAAGERFVALMHKAKAFKEVVAHPLWLGVAWAYVGRV